MNLDGAPTGAHIFFVLVFYKDAAPTEPSPQNRPRKNVASDITEDVNTDY
jgi:hypothetical protein